MVDNPGVFPKVWNLIEPYISVSIFGIQIKFEKSSVLSFDFNAKSWFKQFLNVNLGSV